MCTVEPPIKDKTPCPNVSFTVFSRGGLSVNKGGRKTGEYIKFGDVVIGGLVHLARLAM